MSKHVAVASFIAFAGLASLGGCSSTDDAQQQNESIGTASAAISTNTCSCRDYNNTWDGQPWASNFLGASQVYLPGMYGASQWTGESCKAFCLGKSKEDGLAQCAAKPTAKIIEMQGWSWLSPDKAQVGNGNWYENMACPPPPGGGSSGGSSSGGSSSGGGGHNMECFLSYNACAAVCNGVCEHKVNCGGPSAHKCFE